MLLFFRSLRRGGFLLGLGGVICLFTACDGTSGSSEDTSVGSVAAGVVGGILATSNPNATMASNTSQRNANPWRWANWLVPFPSANAAGACPTLATADPALCTTISSTILQLTYDSCHFGSSTATWLGTDQITNPTGITCGTFPTSSFSRQFVLPTTTSSTPATATRTSSAGTVVTFDDTSTNLSNYQGDSLAPTIGGGYGNEVTFVGGLRTQLTLDRRIYSSLFDHSITGTLNVTETALTGTHTISGSIVVYHNKSKVKGTAAFSSVGYVNTCCTPTSGSITTTFAKTSLSGAVGTALDGKTEKVTFTGCGTATLLATDGTTSTIATNACY